MREILFRGKRTENTSFPNNFCPHCGADMRGERIESYRMQI